MRINGLENYELLNNNIIVHNVLYYLNLLVS